MSAQTQSYHYYPTYPAYPPSAPVPISSKKPGYYPPYPGYAHPHAPQQYHNAYVPYTQMGVSPPEAPESVSTASGTYPSYEPSATGASSSYAGSASEYETSAASATGVDLLEYMGDRLNGSLDPMPLDRGLVKQAQVSGQLNAKTQELLELQKLAQSRLSAMRLDFADGMKAAKEVQRDLQWSQKRVASINERAARHYPQQYKIASQQYPRPVDY